MADMPHSNNSLGVTPAEAEQFRCVVDAALGRLLVRGNAEYQVSVGALGIVARLILHGIGEGGFSIDWEAVTWYHGTDPFDFVRERLDDAMLVMVRDMYIQKGSS